MMEITAHRLERIRDEPYTFRWEGRLLVGVDQVWFRSMRNADMHRLMDWLNENCTEYEVSGLGTRVVFHNPTDAELTFMMFA